MPVPIGVGAGDLIAAVGLLRKTCIALKKHGGAASQYQDTVDRLNSFLQVLEATEAIAIPSTSNDAELHSLLNGLRTQQCICLEVVRKFVDQVEKYESQLGKKSLPGLRSTYMKAKWANHFEGQLPTIWQTISTYLDTLRLLRAHVGLSLLSRQSSDLAKLQDDLQRWNNRLYNQNEDGFQTLQAQGLRNEQILVTLHHNVRDIVKIQPSNAVVESHIQGQTLMLEQIASTLSEVLLNTQQIMTTPPHALLERLAVLEQILNDHSNTSELIRSRRPKQKVALVQAERLKGVSEKQTLTTQIESVEATLVNTRTKHVSPPLSLTARANIITETINTLSAYGAFLLQLTQQHIKSKAENSTAVIISRSQLRNGERMLRRLFLSLFVYARFMMSNLIFLVNSVSLRPPPSLNFVFEDVLGRSFTLPLLYFSDWDRFKDFIQVQFKDHDGEAEVQSDDYRVMDDASDRALAPAEWADFLSSGAKILMSVLLRDDSTSSPSTVCPKSCCGGMLFQSKPQRHTCLRCNIEIIDFSEPRVTEIFDEVLVNGPEIHDVHMDLSAIVGQPSESDYDPMYHDSSTPSVNKFDKFRRLHRVLEQMDNAASDDEQNNIAQDEEKISRAPDDEGIFQVLGDEKINVDPNELDGSKRSSRRWEQGDDGPPGNGKISGASDDLAALDTATTQVDVVDDTMPRSLSDGLDINVPDHGHEQIQHVDHEAEISLEQPIATSDYDRGMGYNNVVFGPKDVITDAALFRRGLAARSKVTSSLIGVGLDPRFKRPIKPNEFFVFGKVFKILWPEMAGLGIERMTAVTNDEAFVSGGTISKIRWFVVVKEGFGSCTCLPISTYGRHGLTKQPEESKWQHSVIYTNNEPELLPGEQPLDHSLRTSIAVRTRNPTDILDPLARLFYGKHYTVEHNVHVYDFGNVRGHYSEILRAQWSQVLDYRGHLRRYYAPASPQVGIYLPPQKDSRPLDQYVDYAVALYDYQVEETYTPVSGGPMDLGRGDRLGVIEFRLDGWTSVWNERTGRTGLVPRDYIELDSTA